MYPTSSPSHSPPPISHPPRSRRALSPRCEAQQSNHTTRRHNAIRQYAPPLPSPRFLFCFALWYTSSAAAVLLSKHVFSTSFPFPLAVTASNNLIAALLSLLCIPSTPPAEASSPSSPSLGFLIGTATALEIGLSNVSLQKLSVTFSTLLKGAAPLSIAAWSAALGVAPLHQRTIFAAVGLMLGLGLASAGQVSMSRQGVSDTQMGVFFQLAAAAVSGLRWTLTQAFVHGTVIQVPAFLTRVAGVFAWAGCTLGGVQGKVRSGAFANSQASPSHDHKVDVLVALSEPVPSSVTSKGTESCTMSASTADASVEASCSSFHTLADGPAPLMSATHERVYSGSNILKTLPALPSQITPSSRRGGTTPLATILATAPATMISLLPFVAVFEGRHIVRWGTTAELRSGAAALGLVAVIGSLVFLLLWTEYELVRCVGAVAVSLLFVVKELLTLVGAKLFFDDKLTATNILGFVLCQICLVLFSHERHACSKKENSVLPS